jgi:hypothetical protein
MRAVFLPVVASLAVLLPAPGLFSADSTAPRPVFTSANGKFTGVIEPGVGNPFPRLRLFEGDPGRPGATAKWEAELTGATAPINVLVSDDGQQAVALADRLRADDEVVTVYIAGRRAFGWSLEQVLLPSDLKALAASQAGRDWCRHAIPLLVDFNDRRYLAAWIAALGRWQVWDLSAARPLVAPAPLLADRCNVLARQSALSQFDRPGGDHVAAVSFLGFLRDARDHQLLERQLKADDDYRSAMHFFNDELHRMNGRSETRKAADAALAAWDGGKPARVVPGPDSWRRARSVPMDAARRDLKRQVAEHFHLNPAAPKDKNARPLKAVDDLISQEQAMIASSLEQREEERYVYLGVVDVSVRLAQRPTQGALWIYLIPEDIGPVRWMQPRPTHRICATFGDAPPGGYPATIPVRFEGVTPGRYWVKAVYDHAEPIFRKSELEGICTPSPGDHESNQRRVIEVVAGKLNTDNLLDCTTACVAR